MADTLRQLQLDESFFVQLLIFVALFSILSQLFFKPFLRLIELRNRKTIEDREEADRLMAEADAQFEQYKRKLAEERSAARKEYEALIEQVRKEEAQVLATARAEAKKITQEAAEATAQQRATIQKQLQGDVETLAAQISQKLMAGRE